MVDLTPWQVKAMTCNAGETAKLSFDEQGRIHAVEYPDGKKIRQFAYEGNSKEITRVVVEDRQRGIVRVFVKQYGMLWIVCNAIGKKLGEWRGTVHLGEDGTYSLRAADQKHNAPATGVWRTYRLDGSEIREYRAADGANATFDASGRLLSAQRRDGAKVEIGYTDGVPSKMIETGCDGAAVVWSKRGKDWICESDPERPIRRAVCFGKRGEIRYIDGAGNKHILTLDGDDRIAALDTDS